MYYPLMQLDKLSSCGSCMTSYPVNLQFESNEPILGKNGLQVGIAVNWQIQTLETAFTSRTLRQQNEVGSEILPNLNNNSWQHRNQVPPKQNQMLPLRRMIATKSPITLNIFLLQRLPNSLPNLAK
jgi:hypothetical protein